MAIDKNELSPEEAKELLDKLLDGNLKLLLILRALLGSSYATSLLRREFAKLLHLFAKEMHEVKITPAQNITDNSPVEALGLDTRTTNLLARDPRFNTVGKLRAATEDELEDIHLLGSGGVGKVQDALKLVELAEGNRQPPTE